jgi:hypothetical protein
MNEHDKNLWGDWLPEMMKQYAKQGGYEWKHFDDMLEPDEEEHFDEDLFTL